MNAHKFKIVGIVSYGVAIPRLRIKTEEIANNWHKDSKAIIGGLGVKEKAVPDKGEDAVTLAVNASKTALRKLKNIKVDIGAIYAGSESHPYAVKSSSAIIGEALGVGNNFTAADLEFACKAGSAGMQMIASMVENKLITHGLAIGTDTAQSKPGDPLEYSASAAGTSFIFGSNPDEIIANLLYTTTFTSDTPDFWRREHQIYPSHAGRFTGEPAYFKHINGAIQLILKQSKMKISDFDHVVLHMPNGKFPSIMAKSLGVNEKQMKDGFVVPVLGNSYSACSLVGLTGVLDVAKPGEKILLCSYGSGSGSDAFIFEMNKNSNKLKRTETLQSQIKNKTYVNYSEYLFNLGKLKR